MSWYRMECGLGRFSVVGTTVRTATLPEHLLADEHHQVLDGQKVYIATTVGNGCCLGAEPAEAAGSDKLKVAYQVFKDEACDVSPKYAPKTVSTGGWKGTQAAWKLLFTKVVILLCFLHGWLKIRDRAKHLKEVFAEVSWRVWDTYHDRPPEFCTTPALAPPVGGRTPHRDRLGEGLGPVWQAQPLVDCLPPPRRPPHEQHARPTDARHEPLHRSGPTPARLAGGWPIALSCLGSWLCNFTPWHPAVARENQGWRCPAERLNQHRYHDCWLQNLLISASLGGYRRPAPQNQ